MRKNQDGTIIIMFAAFLVIAAIVLALLMQNSDLAPVQNSDCSAGNVCSELMEAVSRGDDASIHRLLASGVDVNGADGRGETALHTALRSAQLQVLQTLLQSGANPNLPNKEGVTPFMLVVQMGNRGFVKQFLVSGADVNKGFENDINKDAIDKLTPLMVAAKSGDGPVADMLVEAGASKTAVDSRGWTAADYAKEAHNPVLAERLKK